MPLEYYFMLAGLVLLLIEFVVPGFGFFGVSGMVCLTVGGFYVLGGNAWAALVLVIFSMLAFLSVPAPAKAVQVQASAKISVSKISNFFIIKSRLCL